MPSLSTVDLSALRDQLFSGSEKNQQQAIEALLQADVTGWAVLQDFLLTFKTGTEGNPQPVNWLGGRVYRALIELQQAEIESFLQTHFPTGFVPLLSDRQVDYRPIEVALVQHKFEEADRLTLQKMCELAGPTAVQRKWLYFSEVDQFPVRDLQTIDTLWRVYSEGKFGFSVQREIWISVGQNWEQLWPRIHWKSGNTWTRYPDAFTWNLSAPKGHLPLTNQLRGVRVMASLMNHPAFAPEKS
jgi:hypothetical protein